MKTMLLAAAGILLAAAPVAASAQPYGYYDRRDQRVERQYQRDVRRAEREYRRDVRQAQRRWARGERLDRAYLGDRYYVRDYGRYGLRAPPRGYRWQRVNNDYVLAAVATGLIASVIAAQ
jgi:Ni/Co efflux regulator RcnB